MSNRNLGSSALADGLTAVEAFVRRFVVFGRPEAVVALVLWIAHTYAVGLADATPYLAVTSPAMGSGKTRMLECIGLLANGRPDIFVTPSAATIYRMLEAAPETPLLLDELDAVFGDRSDRYEELRALINAGHRRGATVPRILSRGTKHAVQRFPVFGAKVLAAIGHLPDTVADRSIPIRMVKRKQSEVVEKFRLSRASREAEPIAQALAAAIAATPPEREAEVPDALPDRAADAWEPLIAIADRAGGDWPGRARRAALILHADHADEDSLGLRILADTKATFDRLDVDRLGTAPLIGALREEEESPWVDERYPLTPERLARYLRPFGIRSGQLKIDGANVRGYLREAFVDAWDRYLQEPATPAEDPLPRYGDRAASSTVAAVAPTITDQSEGAAVESLDRQDVAHEEGSIAALGDEDLPAVSGIALAGSRPGPVPVPGPRVVDLAQALPVALRAGPLTISECAGVIGAAPDEIGAALIAARSAGFVIRYAMDGRLHLVEGV